MLLKAVGGEWQEDKPMQMLLCQSKNVEQWLVKMKCEVIKNGTGKNMDNYSAIAIQIK